MGEQKLRHGYREENQEDGAVERLDVARPGDVQVLDVSSRFQAGAQAAELGLLPPSPSPLPRAGHRPRPGEVEAWLLHVPANGAAAMAGAGCLDEGERLRAAAITAGRPRLRYVTAHVGLRVLLGSYLGLAPDQVGFVREPCPMCNGPHGRPALAGESSLHFSMSHSGDAVLFAVASSAVGADVEAPSARHGRFDLSSYLHPAEQRALQALDPAERTAALLGCWVRKEAYLKGVGSGIAGGVGADYVGLEAAYTTGAADAEEPLLPIGWTILDVAVPEGFKAAVALRDGRPPGRRRTCLPTRSFGLTQAGHRRSPEGGQQPVPDRPLEVAPVGAGRNQFRVDAPEPEDTEVDGVERERR
ncbi:4'-phosphopantetheinyl transferase family protein [Streptomyces roseochromogenus]|uniref:4'-phosphopantetheinyl transferase domain-containing protein n=1 Tax=Streptomyces roseochromogenus subsp. oscitans DS 12.976 TaxID=1352936 RepID=V6KC61_STRRC|nr:hypothetical protein M878_21465 [Streptomyces roseochromogenus subsp. oscitans DS 12.976]